MIGEAPISKDVHKVRGRNNTGKYCQTWSCTKLSLHGKTS